MMFRSAYKIDFSDWIDIQENVGGFFDPTTNKRVQLYRDLCPKGKDLAKAKYREERKEYVRSLQKKNISKGNKRVLESYVKTTGDFSETDVYKDLDLSSVSFQQAFVESKTLDEVNFSLSSLNWASFENSTIRECTFKGANLKGAIFKRVNFQGKNNFSKATLNIADFQGCDLRECSFFEASLKEANFTDADLRGVDLSSSKAQGAFFKGAQVDDFTKAPIHIRKICTGLNYIERVVNAETPSKKDLVRVFKNLDKYVNREDYMVFYGRRIERMLQKALEKSDLKQRLRYNLKDTVRKVRRKWKSKF